MVILVEADFALLGQPVDDLSLKLGTVDARLPKCSSITILFPVVMPVPLLVSTIPEHGHLSTNRKYCINMWWTCVTELQTKNVRYANGATEDRVCNTCETAAAFGNFD